MVVAVGGRGVVGVDVDGVVVVVDIVDVDVDVVVVIVGGGGGAGSAKRGRTGARCRRRARAPSRLAGTVSGVVGREATLTRRTAAAAVGACRESSAVPRAGASW